MNKDDIFENKKENNLETQENLSNQINNEISTINDEQSEISSDLDTMDTKISETQEDIICNTQEINVPQSNRVVVRVKKAEAKIPNQNKEIPPSIISLCEDFRSDIAEQEIEAYIKKSNNGKKFAKIACSIMLLLGIGAGTGYFASNYFNSQNTQTPTLNSKNPPITVDIVANSSTDVSLSSVVPGDILTVPQIYEKVAPSTVGIEAETKSRYGTSSGVGTGIIMSDNGYIITNNHVIEDADKLTVALFDGSLYDAVLIGADATTDLAIIKITPDPNNPLTVAEFGDSNSVVVGDLAITIGNPGGLELQGTLTGGYISAINRDMYIDDRVMTLIQTDAAINPGNSGGPLINKYGQVIGINTIKISAESYEGLGFAIPMSDAKPILEELISVGHVTGRPSIGISGYDISKEQAEYNNIPQGLIIKSVDSRSDAYAQGLQENDIVTAVNGVDTISVSEINAVKEEYVAGESITLTIYRNGKYLDISIKLMDAYDLQSSTATEDPLANDQSNSNNSNNSEDYYYDNFPNFSFGFPFGY